MYFFSLNSKSLQRNINRNYMIIVIIINYDDFNIFLHFISFNLFQECKQLYRMNNVKKMLKKLFSLQDLSACHRAHSAYDIRKQNYDSRQ